MGNFWWIGLGLCIAAAAFIVVPLLVGESGGRRKELVLAVALAIAIPLAAFALYNAVGSPDEVSPQTASAPAPKLKTQPGAPGTVNAPPVSELTEKLAQRLENAPDDPEGWALLAQSYNHLGMKDKAREAYERAVQLGYDGARLQEKFDGAEPARAADDIRIAGELVLGESVAGAVEQSDTVFVIARAPGSGRIPVAVQRRPAADFPLRFVLSDADVMMAGGSLAEYEELEVSARLSKTGMAEPSPGDLHAAAQTVVVRGDAPVRLVLGGN